MDGFPLDSEVRAVVEDLAGRLRAAGAEVRPISAPVPLDELMASYQVLLGSVVATDMPAAAQARLRRMRALAAIARGIGAGRASWAGLARAYAASHAEWIAADEVRARLRATVEADLASLDAILAPIAPTVAFPHDQRPFLQRVVHLAALERNRRSLRVRANQQR